MPVTPGTPLSVNVATGGNGDGGGSSDVRTCTSAGPGCVMTAVPGDPRLVVAADADHGLTDEHVEQVGAVLVGGLPSPTFAPGGSAVGSA
ncbi:hypothetical protein [Streptomyces sp. NPDC056192]|uniref:hypothetical protein n=1 Tax=Streptomyces sp. NPDC056192 TaxID=3345743 RepID=UPI0035D839A7